MIGLRTGLAVGLRTGFAVGLGADPLTGASGIAGVSRDASSGKYCPANAAEWTLLMAAAGLATGNPSLLWLCQEASGNLADSIGSFTGVQSGAVPTYQQAVSGWTRVGVKTADGATTKFSDASAGEPDGLTNSQLTLCYFVVTAGNSRGLFGQHTGATRTSLQTTAAHLAQTINNATTTNGTGDIITATPTVAVVKNNRTGSAQTAYTAGEKITTVFDAGVSGKQTFIGAPALNTATATYLYLVSFFNAAAELTDAQVKTLLQTLGWAIPWS